MYRLSARIVPLLFILCAVAPSAPAHGIRLFATVEGTTIHGTLTYADGSPASAAPILACAPDGTIIGEATANESGRFEMQARFRCRHRLVGDAGQGHRGLYTINAEDFPASLPDYGAPLAEAPVPPPESPVAATDPAVSSDLDARIEAAVARQLRPLREQLNGYETAVRLRDVIGGIGYLFGLAGIIALLKTRKARTAN